MLNNDLNSKSVNREFADFYRMQGQIRQERLARINRLASSGVSNDIIYIKRRIVRSPLGPSGNTIIRAEFWSSALRRANLAFDKVGITFQYDPIIDTVENTSFCAFGDSENDNDLFKAPYFSPFQINMYVVESICFAGVCASGMSSVPGKLHSLDSIPNYYVPGNSVLIVPEGIISYEATFVHELGHFFGLLHTFDNSTSEGGQERIDGSNKRTAGDLIEDTRANHHNKKSLGCLYSNSDNCFPDCKDCDFVSYSPQYDNYMSYFSNTRLNKFTDMQYDYMLYIKQKYRGYLYKYMWAQPVNLHEIPNNNIYYANDKVSFSVVKNKYASEFEWHFPGGSPSEYIGSNPIITYSTPGVYSYSIKISNGIHEPYETISSNIIVREEIIGAKNLPIVENFENGLPAQNSGWVFTNRNWDCTYFSISQYSAFGNGNKSMVINNFHATDNSGDESDYSYDEFLSPKVLISDFESVKLLFNYAYAKIQSSIHFDTLYISYRGGCSEKWELKEKRGGNDLSTSSDLSKQFKPNIDDWKLWSIDFIDEIALLKSKGCKTLQIAFKVKSARGSSEDVGNAIYFDNINVRGVRQSSTNSLVSTFLKTDHKFHLTWNDFSNDESGYKVERSINEDGPWVEIADLPANSISYEEFAALPNTIYWYQVKALGSTFGINLSNLSSDTSSEIPVRPSNISVLNSANRQIDISWVGNSLYTTGYNLFYSYTKNGNYDTLVKLDANSTSFIHENVPSNTRIYYFVKAVDHNFSSLPSDTGFVSFLNPTTSTLTKLEYYYDTDPGPGNGTSVNLNSAHAIDRHFVFPVSSLAEGVHQLYFRVQDNIGNWSNVYSNSFLKLKGSAAPAIVDSVEYYFDQFDPGVGKATRIDLTLINGPEYTIPVELSSLSDGAHILHMRSRNSKGLWSTYWSGGFIKLPGDAVSIIDKVEYFIDSDPGFGLGINVPINSLSKIDTSIHLNLSTVSTGVHKLYLRARDAAGLWSNVFSRNFIRVLGDSGRYVTELEYYFDSEPGIGNGNKVSFPTPKAKVDTVLNLNLAVLSDGMHIFYVRSKDVAGQWSNIISKSFFRTTGSGGTPKIIKLEYFVDADPGLGLASNVDTATLSPGVYDVELPINSYALGEHNLYIRAKDSRGLWSVVYAGVFQIVTSTECSCAKLIYTTTKVPSATYQWQVDKGNGFQNIADTGVYFGTHTDSLKISNPPTSYAFNKYRCLIASPSGTSFSSTFELRYNMSWKGSDNDDWHDPKNWGCIVVPDENVDVVVPGSRPNNPVITKDSKVGSLKVESGSSVTVAPGIKLEIKR